MLHKGPEHWQIWVFAGGSWNPSPTETEGQLYIFLKGTAPNALIWFFLCNYANKYHAEKGLVLMDNQRQCFLPGKKVRKDVSI